MNKTIKIIVIIILNLCFIPIIKAQNSNMYKQIWEIEDLYKGVENLINVEKYTKLHQFEDKFILEFKYEKDDIYYAMVLFDDTGKRLNYKYLISDNNEDRHQLYYYKDKIYLIDEDESTTINIYNNNLEKISSKEEYGGDEQMTSINQVTFHENSIYIYYKTTSGSNPIKYNFFVYEYDLDGIFIDSYFYEYESTSPLIFSEEQTSNEIYSKQFYFYDKDIEKSVTFNYAKKDFELIEHSVENEEDYSSVLNIFCESNNLCNYGKIGNYYYVDNHKSNDEVNYIYGNISIKDENLTELFNFKNYSSYKDNLMVSTDKYFIYTVNTRTTDSNSKIYNHTLNKLQDMDINNAILSKIYNNSLYVVKNEDNNIKVNKYNLAYNIFIGDISNGSAGVDNSIKFSGDEVLITTSSMKGYILDSLTVVDEDGEEIKVNNNKFTMPESDIYINAKFVLGEENPNTSDFIKNSMFILLTCICILFFIRKFKWKVS